MELSSRTGSLGRPAQALTSGQLWLWTAVALLPHLSILTAGFAYDDFRFLSENPGIQTLERPHELLYDSRRMSAAFDRDIWRPLRTLGFALQYQLFGSRAAGYHAVSLLLFALLIRTLLGWLRRWPGLSTGAVACAALLLGWHPLSVESVAWISSQGDLLAALFLVACLHYAPTQPILASALATAALLGKESAAPLFVVLWLARAWLPKELRPSLRSALAVTLITVLYVALRQVVLEREFSLASEGLGQVDSTVVERLQVFCWNIALLLRMFLMPWQLSVDYGDGYPSDPSWLHVPLAVIGLLGCVGFWWLLRRRVQGQDGVEKSSRLALLGFALGFAGLCFLPTSGLLVAMKNPTAERFLLLPLIGLCLALAAGLELRRSWLAIAAVWLLFLGVRTGVRALDWQDQLTLFRAELRVHPDSVEANMAVGAELAIQGQGQQAIPYDQRVLELTLPGDERRLQTLYNLAILLAEAGQRLQAVPFLEQLRKETVEFDRLSSLGEQVGAAWLLLGNIYATRVGANSAIPVLTEGIALAGRQPELVAELGFCYSQLQDDRRALHHYEEAVALGSRDPRLLVHLAEVLLRLGRGLEAHEWLHKVLQEHPNYPPARDLLQRLRQNPSYHELDHPPNDPEVEDPP